MQDRLRSKSATAEQLGINIKTLERHVRDGKIGCVRIGRRVFFTDEQIDTFVADHTVDASAAV